MALGEDAWPLGRVIKTGLGEATSRGTTGDVYTYRAEKAGKQEPYGNLQKRRSMVRAADRAR